LGLQFDLLPDNTTVHAEDIGRNRSSATRPRRRKLPRQPTCGRDITAPFGV
jgi:hypothetical protein